MYKTLRLAANILDAQYADVKNVQTQEYTDLAAALAETVEGANLRSGVRRYAAV